MRIDNELEIKILEEDLQRIDNWSLELVQVFYNVETKEEIKEPIQEDIQALKNGMEPYSVSAFWAYQERMSEIF